MSDFMDLLLGLLPSNSPLQKKDNPVRKVLDESIGEYMDNTGLDFNNLFLDTATGGWLDAFGRDYGVSRKIDESDDDYRQRIIFEKLEYLTADNLSSIYGLTLYSFVEDFDVNDNCLTSDNPYVNNRFMSYAPLDLQEIINKKFILGDSITWLE